MRLRGGALALALVVAACGGGGATKGADLTIALVAGNLADPYWRTFQCGAEREAERLGVTLKPFVSATSSAQEMATNFNAAVLAKPDAISYNPFQTGQLAARVRTLMAQGIPVATTEPLRPDTGYIAVGSTRDGGTYAEFAAELAGSSGKIAVLGGIAGSVPLRERYEPLLAAIRRLRPHLEVLPTQFTDFDVSRASQITASLMLAHPDLKLVIASTGPEGQGVAAAVRQADRAGQVKVLSFDAVPAQVQALRQGTIQGLVAQSPGQAGAIQVAELVKYLRARRGVEPVKPIAPRTLPLRLITAENVDASGAWMYTSTCEER